MSKFSKEKIIRWVSCGISLGLFLSIFNATVAENGLTTEAVSKKTQTVKEDSYEEYLTRFSGQVSSAIELPIDRAVLKDGANKKDSTIFFESKNAEVTWTVEVPQTGYYNFEMKYAPVLNLGKEMLVQVSINGKIPYDQASRIALEQLWQDDLTDNNEFVTDSLGNDLLPDAIQSDKINVVRLMDHEGYYSEPLLFYLEKGENQIGLSSFGEGFFLYAVTLQPPSQCKTYEEYKNTFASKKNDVDSDWKMIIQAEHPTAKSDASLYAAFDRSDPLLEPIVEKGNKRNIIGTNNWKSPGQYLEWDFEIPKDGIYQIGFKYRQDSNRGLYNLRKLMLDGEIPFAEAAGIQFPYSEGFEVLMAGNGDEAYQFYLQKGFHTLRLEVTLGEIADTLRQIDAVRVSLSSLVQRIMMVTSVNPDLYRDYYLEDQLPTMVSELKELAELLDEQMLAYEKSTGKEGSNAVTLGESADLLRELSDKTHLIPEKLGSLSDTVSTLATWVNNRREQLVELDYLIIAAPTAEMPKAHATFFQKLLHEIKAMLISFSEEYTTSSKTEGEVEVWISGGRDQRDVLKELIYAENLPFAVNTKLVSASITNAIMAGVGPDVVLNLAHTEPVNLGMRGALEPLNAYQGFDELKLQFSKEAFVPYELEGKTYALPNTETFEVMFIRTDVFERLGLSVPETWEEFFAINRILQQNKMEAGLPANFFPMLLYQNGGSYFNAEKTAMDFNNELTFSVFKQWVDLYREYSFSLFKEDYNRFRSGEMPMLISSYSLYSKIYAAAPEILGDWKMYRIPGTKKSDGTIDRTAIAEATGTASVILADSKNKENAWSFLKWFASSDTQAAFGNRLEYVMGVAGRYNPANIEAFKQLPWTSDELDTILAQWDDVRQIPEVPGGYYVSRNIDNAFRACTVKGKDIKETFTYWMQETNKEIKRKRDQYINN